MPEVGITQGHCVLTTVLSKGKRTRHCLYLTTAVLALELVPLQDSNLSLRDTTVGYEDLLTIDIDARAPRPAKYVSIAGITIVATVTGAGKMAAHVRLFTSSYHL